MNIILFSTVLSVHTVHNFIGLFLVLSFNDTLLKYMYIYNLFALSKENKKINQRTNGPVNAHLISWPSKSTKQTKPGDKYEKDLINKS